MVPTALSLALLLAGAALCAASRMPPGVLSRQEEESESARSFSYDPSAADGPQNWFLLEPSYAACGAGLAQSPIDFPCPADADGDPLVLDEEPDVSSTAAQINVVQTTFNFELECAEEGACGSTQFNGSEFDLLNIHFHSPSEHDVGGVTYPLEAHMVHQSSEGALLVISVMFSFGPDGDCITTAPLKKGRNRALSPILAKVLRGKTQFSVDTGSFLEEDTSFCMYPGSLTTPPCTEGVTWMLAENRQTVTPMEVAVFQTIVGGLQFGNARPIQARNGREVLFAPEVIAA